MNLTEVLSLSDFSQVLEYKNLFDIYGLHWKRLSVRHGQGSLEHYNLKEPQQLRSLFKEQRHVPGIYAYFSEKRCLYIGKSKNLQERIYQHYLESCDIWGHPRYREFFSKNCGDLDLFILPLGKPDRNGELLRTIVEKVLEAHFCPELQSVKL